MKDYRSWRTGTALTSFIFFPRSGEIASNRVNDQEVAVLLMCLHLQRSLVYVNTFMLRRILSETEWRKRFYSSDWRGLSPLLNAKPPGRKQELHHEMLAGGSTALPTVEISTAVS